MALSLPPRYSIWVQPPLAEGHEIRRFKETEPALSSRLATPWPCFQRKLRLHRMSHMPQALFQGRTRVDLPLILPWLCPPNLGSARQAENRAQPCALEEKGHLSSSSPEGGEGMAPRTTTTCGVPTGSCGIWGFLCVNSGSLGWLLLRLLLPRLPRPTPLITFRCQSPGMQVSWVKSQPWVRQQNQPWRLLSQLCGSTRLLLPCSACLPTPSPAPTGDLRASSHTPQDQEGTAQPSEPP